MLAKPLRLPWVHSWESWNTRETHTTIPAREGTGRKAPTPTHTNTPPAATSMDRWLLSGTRSNLSHLPTHLSTAKTGALCDRVAQMPGNLTPGMKEKATGETTDHLVPRLLPFTARGQRLSRPDQLTAKPWDHKDYLVRLASPYNRGQRPSRVQDTSPLASFSKQLECYFLSNILVETKVHCRS